MKNCHFADSTFYPSFLLQENLIMAKIILFLPEDHTFTAAGLCIIISKNKTAVKRTC